MKRSLLRRLRPGLTLLGALLLVAPASRASSGVSEDEASRLAKRSAETATWVGFRQTGPKSSLVYVHLTSKVPVSSSKTGKKIVITLSNTKIEVKNNQNPLITSHFDSVVERARMFESGPDVQLEIILKQDASFSSKVVQEEPGAVLYVELIRP